jgi:hypothetical protein
MTVAPVTPTSSPNFLTSPKYGSAGRFPAGVNRQVRSLVDPMTKPAPPATMQSSTPSSTRDWACAGAASTSDSAAAPRNRFI